jgi:hypothetical protein
LKPVASVVYKLTEGAACEKFKAGWHGQYAEHSDPVWLDQDEVIYKEVPAHPFGVAGTLLIFACK